MSSFILYLVYPVIGGISIGLTIFGVKKYYEENNLKMNTVISVAKNQIKNQIQKTLDVSISFGIPIIALVYLFIFGEVSKFMVFQVAIFSMLLCFGGCWYVMRLFLEKQLAVNQIILQVVKK